MDFLILIFWEEEGLRATYIDAYFLSINLKIKFFIYTLPHRHATIRILSRRPHSFDPLGPRRNPILLFARLFLVFLSLLTNEKADLSNLPSFVYDHIPSLICELRVDDLANRAQQSLHRGSPSGLL